MITMFFLLFALGLVAYVVIQLLLMYKAANNGCKACDGQGFWRGTRGEKNLCKVCGGSGQQD